MFNNLRTEANGVDSIKELIDKAKQQVDELLQETAGSGMSERSFSGSQQESNKLSLVDLESSERNRSQPSFDGFRNSVN